jgi:TonB family protein
MVDSTAAYDRGMDASSFSVVNGERGSAERAPRTTVQGFDELERSGPEHVAALLEMGGAKQESGEYIEAEDLFRRALELGERVLGPDNPALAAALMNLAGARIVCAKPETAEPLVIRALSITEKTLGDHDPDFAILVNDLARLCIKQSAHAVAEPLLLRLLSMKRSKGDDHPEVATVLASLAGARQGMGRHESAEQLWRRVLDIRERTLAPNHLGLATALERLADSCSARGKIGEALQLLQRALTIRELTLGAGNPSLRVLRDRIADLQLQASEDSLDVSIVETPAPAPEKYRLVAADHSAQNVPRNAREKTSTKVRIEKPVAEPRKATAAASVFEIAPVTEAPLIDAPVKVAPTKEALPNEESLSITAPSNEAVNHSAPDDVEELKPDLANYRDVILSIQQDLDEDEDDSPTASDRARVIAGTIGIALKQRQKEIAVVAGAVVLVAVLTTVSQGLIKSRQGGAAQETTARSAAAQTTIPAAVTTPLVNDRPKPPAVASAEATPVAPSPKARVVEQRTPSKKAPEPKAIAIPTMSSTVLAGFDSVVRAHTIAPRLATEPPAVILPAVSGAAEAIVSPAPEAQVAPAPQRARLIGKLPAPHYPEQVADVQGDVRVQFEVDASGRPVVSSLSVLSSSNEFFTAAVLKVIPGLRFNPALSGGTDSKPTSDVVRLGFAFRPAK